MFLANPLAEARRQFAASNARRTIMNSAGPRADAPAPPVRPTPPAPVPPPVGPDDERDPAMHAARARERGRVAAILLSEPAHRDPTMAIKVAIETSVSRDNAIAALATVRVRDETLAATTAEQILNAAREARKPTKVALPPPGSTARAILEAGARARGETL